MEENVAIHLEKVSKVFGRGQRRVEAVRGLDLTVEAGQVFGFLGPNGAGKTTTIRMIMDLIRPTAGQIYVFGEPVQARTGVLRRKVGALVETAAFYGFMSARENLEVLALTNGLRDRARVEQLLEQVGLADRADRPVEGYSTGMKQRLGLAAALLNEPDLVILDEPTNGLDPAGIQETRAVIRWLADEQGKTVFLSSHLLSEVEQVCDQVAIISRGQVVRAGNVAQLLTGHTFLRIEAAPLEQAAITLQERWVVERDGNWLNVQASREEAPSLVANLVARDVSVFQVAVQQQTLESYFLEATR